jgi:hypothetical protein
VQVEGAIARYTNEFSFRNLLLESAPFSWFRR